MTRSRYILWTLVILGAGIFLASLADTWSFFSTLGTGRFAESPTVQSVQRVVSQAPPRAIPAPLSTYLAKLSEDPHDGLAAMALYSYLKTPAASELTASENSLALLTLAKFQIGEGNDREATRLATRSIEIDPTRPEGYWILSQLAYARDDLPSALSFVDEAFASWDDSSTNPPRSWQRFEERLLREIPVESRYVSLEGRAVILRADPRIPAAWSSSLLDTAEDGAAQLQSLLQFTPTRPITVVLYEQRAYREAVHAPAWSGALFDGKIRIPITLPDPANRNAELPAKVRRALRHELAHAFIHQQPQGISSIPTWLEEGLAQWIAQEEVPSTNSKNSQVRSLSFLQENFLNLPAERAQDAYHESAVLVRMLVDRQGPAGLRALIAELRNGERLEVALAAIYGTSLSDLWSKSLAGQSVNSGTTRNGSSLNSEQALGK